MRQGRTHAYGDRVRRELQAVTAFARRVNAHRDLRAASEGSWLDAMSALQTRLDVLTAMKDLARSIDPAACEAPVDHYGRRVLHDDPAGWSVAAITLRNGQQTEAHDHDGWGAVVTVQGIERDRRYQLNDSGEPRLIVERDYPPGTGYLFDPADIHQPVGADPSQLTIALHLLVHGHGEQHRHEAPGDRQ
jgi:predicted metal-dependent enzyme (double-stranded beta helix superfamily)